MIGSPPPITIAPSALVRRSRSRAEAVTPTAHAQIAAFERTKAGSGLCGETWAAASYSSRSVEVPGAGGRVRMTPRTTVDLNRSADAVADGAWLPMVVPTTLRRLWRLAFDLDGCVASASCGRTRLPRSSSTTSCRSARSGWGGTRHRNPVQADVGRQAHGETMPDHQRVERAIATVVVDVDQRDPLINRTSTAAHRSRPRVCEQARTVLRHPSALVASIRARTPPTGSTRASVSSSSCADVTGSAPRGSSGAADTGHGAAARSAIRSRRTGQTTRTAGHATPSHHSPDDDPHQRFRRAAQT